MSLKLSMDDCTKDYAKSIRSLWEIIEKHPDINPSRFSCPELEKSVFQQNVTSYAR